MDQSLNAIQTNRTKAETSLKKIASGTRLVSAGEDPTATSISAQLRSEITSLSQAVNNIESGKNFIRSAEGGLSSISDLITRGRELSLQAANGTLGDTERQTINQEFTAIKDEIDRISQSSEFNGQKLLNGDLAPDSATRIDIQAGTGSSEADRINLNVVENTGTESLGISGEDISTADGALQAFDALGSAASKINSLRGQVGAVTNRLESSVNSTRIDIENLSQSESSLAGTDFAAEITNLQQNTIQLQVSLQALAIQNRQNESATGRLLNTLG